MAGGRHNSVRVKDGNREVAATSTTTDAPLLPVDQIERLAAIRPDCVDWVLDQTQCESDHRRSEVTKINRYIFVEKLAGLVFALLIAIAGLGAAVYLAMNGREVTASVIGGSTLVGLVASFIAGKKSSDG